MSVTAQSLFAAAILDRAKETPPGLVSSSGARPIRRFGVYRNTVLMGLTQALAIRFPATEAIVAKEFFAAMARAYVMQHPPRSPILLHYGSGFPDFVESFAPAAALPYLADVVRLENARIEAYHAADVTPLAEQSLHAIDRDRLAGLRFAFHPSFAVIRSIYPIVTIWAMNSGELPLAPIDDWFAEDALVVRPRLGVLTHRLPPGGAVFLKALADGQSIDSATEAAQGDAADFDLAANLAGLFGSGAVIGVSHDRA